APNELRVARDHFDDLGRKVYLRPSAVLDSLLTAFANRDRDLIGAAPRVGRSPQNLARHLEEKRVVIHRSRGPTPNHSRSFAKRGVRLRAHVEAKNVPTRLGSHGIGGPVSGLPTRHEPLDLSHGLAARSLQPLMHGVPRHHARKLTHGGPGKNAVTKSGAKLGNPLEDDCRPELGIDRSEAISEQLFGVLRKRRIAEVPVHLGAKRTKQRQPLAPIELGALLREPLELFVCQDPIRVPIDPNTRFHESSIHPCFAASLLPRKRDFSIRITTRVVSAPKRRQRATEGATEPIRECPRAPEARAHENPSRKIGSTP